MPRTLPQIIAHIEMVVANPQVSTTLIQTEDLEVLCAAAKKSETEYQRGVEDGVAAMLEKLRVDSNRPPSNKEKFYRFLERTFGARA